MLKHRHVSLDRDLLSVRDGNVWSFSGYDDRRDAYQQSIIC